jgi:hypothetical protein
MRGADVARVAPHSPLPLVAHLYRPGGGGGYPTQDGFSWTKGVMLKLMALYPADADLEGADFCPAGHGS